MLHLQKFTVADAGVHGARRRFKKRGLKKKKKAQIAKASGKPARPSPDGFAREELVAQVPT